VAKNKILVQVKDSHKIFLDGCANGVLVIRFRMKNSSDSISKFKKGRSTQIVMGYLTQFFGFFNPKKQGGFNPNIWVKKVKQFGLNDPQFI
jgi:hypothetical protein